MNSRWYCNRAADIKHDLLVAALLGGCICGLATRAIAADAPPWMHAVVSVPLPAHDDKTDAVLLYSDEVVTVQSENKVQDGDSRGV